MKKIGVILSVVIAAVALLALMLSVASAATVATATLTSAISDGSPVVGDTVIVTLRFRNTGTTTLGARVTDPNPASAYLAILTGTISSNAIYSPAIDAVVWQGPLVTGTVMHTVTYQMRVTGIPTTPVCTGYGVTKTSTMVDLETPGSLPETTAAVWILIRPASVQAPVNPYTDTTVCYPEPGGMTTTVDIPAGAVEEVTGTLVITGTGGVAEPPHPFTGNLKFAGRLFQIDFFVGGVVQPGFVFSNPVTITLNYRDEDLEGPPPLFEPDLRLYYWSDSASEWTDAINTCTPPMTYTRDLDANWLKVPICHLSTWALASIEEQRLYLPLIMRNVSGS
jgi:hypothetical protein